MSEQIVCGSCRCTISGESFYDHYFKKRLCKTCYTKNFDHARSQSFGEWFESNYRESDYDRNFWNSVCAFMKLPSNG